MTKEHEKYYINVDKNLFYFTCLKTPTGGMFEMGSTMQHTLHNLISVTFILNFHVHNIMDIISTTLYYAYNYVNVYVRLNN